MTSEQEQRQALSAVNLHLEIPQIAPERIGCTGTIAQGCQREEGQLPGQHDNNVTHGALMTIERSRLEQLSFLRVHSSLITVCGSTLKRAW